MDEQMKAGMQPPPKKPKCQEGRIALDDIRGDWLTHKEFVAWTGLSTNAAYELLRQEPFRQAVRHFGRQIRISKKALARLMEGDS